MCSFQYTCWPTLPCGKVMAHVSKLLPKSVGPPPASSDDHREVLASSFLVNVRIGEGRTAEVLRNLCFQIYWLADQSSWKELVAQIRSLFGVRLNPPEFIKERGQITMSHDDGGLSWTWYPLAGAFNRLCCFSLISTPTLEPSCPAPQHFHGPCRGDATRRG
jgi:hypothetical protein